MTPEGNTKKKFLALITVIFLFLLVGSLFFVISLDNKKKTEILRNLVKEQQEKKEMALKLDRMQISTSTLPGISSESFLTLAVAENGQKKILIEKNPDQPLPIASITKLMVAVVSLENVSPKTEITATLDYIGQEESAFILEVGKKYTVNDLLANALIPSDNDSARLLGSTLGEKNFIDKMNLKAGELGLTQTHFTNVTGLDPAASSSQPNVSSVTDLANLLIYIKNKHPEILKITTHGQYNVCATDNFCKMVTSTDKLLGDKEFKYKIIGGKTGNTDLAGKNLALITEPINKVFLINIVLGSTDNFADTIALINNVKIKN